MDDEYVVKLDLDGSILELPLDKLCLNEQMLQFYKQGGPGQGAGFRGFPSIDLGKNQFLVFVIFDELLEPIQVSLFLNRNRLCGGNVNNVRSSLITFCE